MRIISRRPARLAGGVVIALLGVTGCVNKEPQLDARPLSDRTAIAGAPVSLSTPWWRSAQEASPSTHWRVNGVPEAQNTVFVVGKVLSVDAGFGLGKAASEPRVGSDSSPGERVVAFNSKDSFVDVVIISLEVRDGVAESGDMPAQVRIALPLPAPTDLASLRTELDAIGSFAAVLFPAVGMAVEPGLYEILDGRYLGAISDDGATITFGDLMRGPDPAKAVEVVTVAKMIAGSGTIALVNAGGERALDG